jgi:FAD/FMN-containing dehydrogenase
MNIAVPTRETVLAALSARLPDGGLLTRDGDLARYRRDWSGDFDRAPLAVARPRTASDVVAVLEYCHEVGVRVVPQGGLTGLVGGAVAADEHELVISLERMNRVLAVDPVGFTMTVEAGCILENARRAADEVDCLLPLDLGARGSCHVGGNVSTNAGGFNVLRYGMARDLVLGLQVVLADGRVWDGLRTLRKDNRGYDLKQLFIGAEGTLGIVTAVAFKLYPRPQQVETVLVGLRSVDDALALFGRARRECCDLLCAFELMDRACIDFTLADRPELGEPLSTRSQVYALIEASATGRVDLRALMEGFLNDAADVIQDGVIASSRAQAARLWAYREALVEAQTRVGRYLRTDVSVSLAHIPAFMHEALRDLRAHAPALTPLAFGHVGDGNIHLSVVPPASLRGAARDAALQAAEQVVFDAVDRHGGSISAEHGIGIAKQDAYLDRTDAVTLDLAARLKDAFDPKHLLSDGRILPSRGAPLP